MRLSKSKLIFFWLGYKCHSQISYLFGQKANSFLHGINQFEITPLKNYSLEVTSIEISFLEINPHNPLRYGEGYYGPPKQKN